MRFRTVLAAVLPFAFAACGGSSELTAPVPIESTTFAASLGVDLAASTKTPSGLYYRDISVGTGATIVSGQTVNVKYSGALADGSVFDAHTASFNLNGVIPGFREGLIGMKIGGKRQLVIPPSLGYGSSGSDKIPPNAVLVFTVEPL